MKKMFVLVVAAVMLSLCGCSVFNDPAFAGNISGKAVYLAYSRVAEKQSPEFRSKVADIWTEVNKVQSTSDLVEANTVIIGKFDEVLKTSNLTDSDRAMLQGIRDEIAKKIDQVINDGFALNSEGIEFLLGMRDGVNSLIEISNER